MGRQDEAEILQAPDGAAEFEGRTLYCPPQGGSLGKAGWLLDFRCDKRKRPALGSGPRYIIRVTLFCTLRESENTRTCENCTLSRESENTLTCENCKLFTCNSRMSVCFLIH